MENTSAAPRGVGDPLPPGCAGIEVHVGELKQLFNSMDPTPFRARDLDPSAEEFIVDWASELHAIGRWPWWCMSIAGRPEETRRLKDAVREFFKQRALSTRRRLRQLFQVGRISLLIGLVVVAASMLIGDIARRRCRRRALAAFCEKAC